MTTHTTQTFLSTLCSSQMFTQFITDRLSKSSQDPEILVFDEYIKLKLNRSKLKFVKEETPFLNVTYHVIFHCLLLTTFKPLLTLFPYYHHLFFSPAPFTFKNNY